MSLSRNADVVPAVPTTATAPGFIEALVVGCLLFSGAGLFLDVAEPEVYDLYWLVFMVAAMGLAWQVFAGNLLLVLLRLPLLVVVLALAVASVTWSIAPDRTVKVAAALVGTSLVGLYAGYRFRGTALLGLLGSVLFMVLLANTVVALIPNGYGTEPFDRGYLPAAWKGAARHRNMLGAHAALGVLLSAAVWLLLPRWRLFAMLGGGLAMLVLVMAQSMSALAATGVGLVVMLAFWLGKSLRVPTLVMAVALVLVGGLAAWIATDHPGAVAEALGRDPTLTSRVDIWDDAKWIVQARPLTGFGYGAVWAGFDSTPFPQLETMRWSPHAHNGFLQLATEIGVPGSALAVLFYLATLLLAIRRYARAAAPATLLMIGTLCMAVVLNVSEAWLFAPYELFWMVFVALATAEAADTV